MKTYLSPGESVTIVLGGAATTTELTYRVQYADNGIVTETQGSTSGATTVTMVTAPSTGGAQRIVENIFVYNGDTAEADVTIKKVSGSSSYKIAVVTMQVGDHLQVDDDIPRVTDEAGQTGASSTPSELAGVSAGTVTASKAVVVDSNKDIGDFRNLDVVNLDAGASGTAGTVDIFPSTATTGKTSFTCTANAGNTTTTITTAEQAGARTYTVPDAGASASFVMTGGAQTLAGVKTFTSVPVVDPATGTAGGIDLKSTTDATGTFRLVAADSAGDTITTVTHASQAGARTYTIPDAGASASFIMTEGAWVFNESSADVDARWESNALANFMYLDASECLNGTLSIGAVAPTNPQCIFAVLPPANASGVTANQSYFHTQMLPGGAVTIPAGTAPVVASLNIHEPNITATGTVTDAATVRIVDAPTEGTNNHAFWVDAGSARFDGAIFQGGNAGAASTVHRLIIPPKACADNTATDLVTVTVPNANHAAVLRITLVGRSAGTDAFESVRCAEGLVVLARTTGANVVAAAAALALAQIATVSGGDTFTLAYGVSSITGAVGDPNTFTVQVTLDSAGNQACSCMALVELINESATGVTMAAS